MKLYVMDTAWQFKMISKCLTFIHAFNSSFYCVCPLAFWFCWSDESFFFFLVVCCYAFLCFYFFCRCVTSMLTGLVGQQMNHQIYLNALKMICHKLFLSKEKFNPFLLLHLKLFVCTEIFFIRRFTKSKNSHDHLQCRSLHRSFVTVISCCLVIFAHCWSSYCFIDNVKM